MEGRLGLEERRFFVSWEGGLVVNVGERVKEFFFDCFFILVKFKVKVLVESMESNGE